jgi:hypothetical protein
VDCAGPDLLVQYHLDCQQLVKILSSTFIKALWLASTTTSSKDRCIGAYSIVLTILSKLGCPI